MVMRLLKKSEVNERRVVEMRQQADEGLKLAKRIDALRETLAEEELSLRDFRNKEVSRINLEIEELTARRDALSREIEGLLCAITNQNTQ
jgi:hypothetical protein